MATKTTTDYLKSLIDSWKVSKSEMSKFYAEIKKTANAKKLPIKTWADLNNIITQMDSSITSKYPQIFDKFQTAWNLYDLEKKVWSEKASYIYNQTNPEALQQNFSANLDRIKNDPKYQEFRWKYESFIRDDYWLALESINGQYKLTKQSIEQQKTVAKQQFNNLQEDVAKYTQYAKEDYITDLAKTNQQLSWALQNATESYWQRNLLQSWLSRIAKQNTIWEWMWVKKWLGTELDRRISDLITQNERWKQSYYNNLENIQMQENSLELETDLKKRQATLSKAKSEFELKNTKDEQAYSQTIYQQQKEQNNKINQVIQNLYQ